MTLRLATEKDLFRLAEIYTLAFPESVTFYYGKDQAKRVQQLMVPSWQILLNSGAKIICFGEPVVGYCCYHVEDHLAQRKTFSYTSLQVYYQAFKNGDLQISLPEILSLVQSQFLMKRHYNLKLPIPRGRILSLAILPDYQSMGIGRLLLEKALLDIGNQPVILEVRPENIKAYRLYKSFGFAEKGQTRDLLGSWLIMLKTKEEISSEERF